MRSPHPSATMPMPGSGYESGGYSSYGPYPDVAPAPTYPHPELDGVGQEATNLPALEHHIAQAIGDRKIGADDHVQVILHNVAKHTINTDPGAAGYDEYAREEQRAANHHGLKKLGIDYHDMQQGLRDAARTEEIKRMEDYLPIAADAERKRLNVEVGLVGSALDAAVDKFVAAQKGVIAAKSLSMQRDSAAQRTAEERQMDRLASEIDPDPIETEWQRRIGMQAGKITAADLPVLARATFKLNLTQSDTREALEATPDRPTRGQVRDMHQKNMAAELVDMFIQGGLSSEDLDYVLEMRDQLLEEEMTRRRIAASDFSQRFENSTPSLPTRIMQRIDHLVPGREHRLEHLKASNRIMGSLAVGAVLGTVAATNPGNIEHFVISPEAGIAGIPAFTVAAVGINRLTRGYRQVRHVVNAVAGDLEQADYMSLPRTERVSTGRRTYHENMKDLVKRIGKNDNLSEIAEEARLQLVDWVGSDTLELPSPAKGGSIEEYIRAIVDATRNTVDYTDMDDRASRDGYTIAVIRRLAKRKTPHQLWSLITDGHEPPEPPAPDDGSGGGPDSGTGPATGSTPTGRWRRQKRDHPTRLRKVASPEKGKSKRSDEDTRRSLVELLDEDGIDWRYDLPGVDFYGDDESEGVYNVEDDPDALIDPDDELGRRRQQSPIPTEDDDGDLDIPDFLK